MDARLSRRVEIDLIWMENAAEGAFHHRQRVDDRSRLHTTIDILGKAMCWSTGLEGGLPELMKSCGGLHVAAGARYVQAKLSEHTHSA